MKIQLLVISFCCCLHTYLYGVNSTDSLRAELNERAERNDQNERNEQNEQDKQNERNGQDEQNEQNNRTELIEEVVVTGTRNATDIRHLSQTVQVIDRAAIEASNRSSVLPLLTEQVPGLFVTSRGVLGYGVSEGAAGNISLRGLSSSASRFLVLIDGHPQYAGIYGHANADAYQSMATERVEVLRGPASLLYGSNAMGGVMNIVTRKQKQDGVRTTLHAGYGLYNTLETEVTNSLRKGAFSSFIGADYNRSDGHRENMGFQQYGGQLRLGYDISSHWKVSADANVIHFDASQPGAVDAPLIDADQNITRGVASLFVENEYDKTSGVVSVFYNFGKHWINDGYHPSETPKDYRFSSFDDMMGVSAYQSARLFNGNRTTFGFDFFRYGGIAHNVYDNGTEELQVDKHEQEIAGYVDFRQNIKDWMTVNAGFRVDHHSTAGTTLIPQAGLSFILPHDIGIKLSASKGFRHPTLREMYMYPPQNPDLLPEELWNYELAFHQSLINSRLTYGINLFYIDAKNIILTLPNPSGAGKLNQNSGQLKNIGIEAQLKYHINKVWALNANYSFLHMKVPVISAPEHKAYAGVSFSKGIWHASIGTLYIAGLYTSTDPVVQTSFVNLNAKVSAQVCKWLNLWVNGDNLTNSQYEIIKGYPMPEASFMLGINIVF